MHAVRDVQEFDWLKYLKVLFNEVGIQISRSEPVLVYATSFLQKLGYIRRITSSRYALFNEPKMNIVGCRNPSKGRGSKTQNDRFRCKIALRLKNVCYKVSLCENCQRQSCKAFIGLTIRSRMIGGGRPLLRENLANTDPPHLLSKRRFLIYFTISPQPQHLVKKV